VNILSLVFTIANMSLEVKLPSTIQVVLTWKVISMVSTPEPMKSLMENQPTRTDTTGKSTGMTKFGLCSNLMSSSFMVK